MIPSLFDYVRVHSKAEALAALTEHGEDAKLMAGGQSLLPLMKLRLASPEVLIDASGMAELTYIKEQDGYCTFGAMTRYCDILKSEAANELAPLLVGAVGNVGDRQVRHRGTLGGATAHGDPASDVPAALLCLDAEMVVAGVDGERIVHAKDFFQDFLETDIESNELLVEIRIPIATAKWKYEKFVRRAQDWAIVAVAATATENGPAIALANMGSTPLRASAVEQAIREGSSPAEAAKLADAGCNPVSDGNASEDYRRSLARTLVRRALEDIGFA